MSKNSQYKASLKNMMRESSSKEDDEEHMEQILEFRMMITTTIFILFVFLGIFIKLPNVIPTFMFIGLIITFGLMLWTIGSYALRAMSVGFVSMVHHSSLRRPGPLDIVRITSVEGKTSDFAIFDLGGISVNFFQEDGGGKRGYYVVPTHGYIASGGSVTVFYRPVRFHHNQLPESIKRRLLEHPKYKIGNPVWFALFPKEIDTKIIEDAFSSTATQRSVSDLLLLLKVSSEHETVAVNHRRAEMMFSTNRLRKEVLRSGGKEYGAATQDELDSERRNE